MSRGRRGRQPRERRVRPGSGGLYIGSLHHLALFWMVLAKIGIAVLFFDPLGYEPYSRAKSAMGLATTTPLLALILLALWRYGDGIWPRARLHVWVLVIVAGAVASTVLAPNGFIALFGARGSYQGLLHLVEMAILYSAAALAIRRESDLRLLVGAAAAAVAIVLAYAGLQQGGIDLIPPTGVIVSTLGNRAFVGHLVAVAAAVSLWVAVGTDWFRPAIRITAIVALVISLSALALLATRSAIPAVAVAAVISIVTRLRSAGSARALPRSALLMLAFGAGTAAALVPFTPLGARLLDALEGIGIRDRLLIYGSAVDALVARPLTGYGPDGFAVAFPEHRPPGSANILFLVSETSAHNFVLQWAANGGIPGLVAIIGFGVSTIRQIWSTTWAGAPRAAGILLSAVSAYWVYALFSPEALSLAWVPWSVAGSAVGLARAVPRVARLGAQPLPLAALIAVASVLVAASGANAIQADREAAQAVRARDSQLAGQALLHANEALRLDGARAQYWQELAFAYVLQEQWGRAAEAYEEAIRREPHDVTYRSNLARARLLEALEPGATLTAREAARTAAADARRVDPEDPEPWFVSAQVANALGEYEDALHYAKAAIDRFVYAEEYDLEAQLAATRMSDPALAERVLREALAVKESPTLRLAIAQVLLRRGDRGGAARELRDLLARYPGSPEAARLLEDLGR